LPTEGRPVSTASASQTSRPPVVDAFSKTSQRSQAAVLRPAPLRRVDIPKPGSLASQDARHTDVLHRAKPSQAAMIRISSPSPSVSPPDRRASRDPLRAQDAGGVGVQLAGGPLGTVMLPATWTIEVSPATQRLSYEVAGGPAATISASRSTDPWQCLTPPRRSLRILFRNG